MGPLVGNVRFYPKFIKDAYEKLFGRYRKVLEHFIIYLIWSRGSVSCLTKALVQFIDGKRAVVKFIVIAVKVERYGFLLLLEGYELWGVVVIVGCLAETGS